MYGEKTHWSIYAMTGWLTVGCEEGTGRGKNACIDRPCFLDLDLFKVLMQEFLFCNTFSSIKSV
jgi:hypothetical protein